MIPETSKLAARIGLRHNRRVSQRCAGHRIVASTAPRNSGDASGHSVMSNSSDVTTSSAKKKRVAVLPGRVGGSLLVARAVMWWHALASELVHPAIALGMPVDTLQ